MYILYPPRSAVGVLNFMSIYTVSIKSGLRKVTHCRHIFISRLPFFWMRLIVDNSIPRFCWKPEVSGSFVENEILRFGTTPSPCEYFELRSPSKVCRRVGAEKLPKLIDFLSWWYLLFKPLLLTQFDAGVIATDKPLASLRK